MTMHAIGLTTLNNTAKDFRNDMSVTMFGATSARPTGARSGVRYGTPTNTVSLVAFAGTIKPHSGVMDVQTAAAAGPYFYAVTANETFTVNAAHATLPRVDIVTIRINDNVEDSSGLESATAHYTAGTANAAPVAPTPTTTREMVIAQINVPASGGGNPTVSWVAPTAVAAGGIVPVRTTTERAALYTAYPATTDCPVIVWQSDIKRLLTTTDGVNWKLADGTFYWADATARAAATGMAAGDKGYQASSGLTYEYAAGGWAFPGMANLCDARLSSSVAIGTGGAIMLWGAEATDIPGWHSTVTNTDRITVTKDGTYRVHVHVEINNSTQTLVVDVRKNAVVIPESQNANNGAGANSMLDIDLLMSLVSGDYITVVALAGAATTAVQARCYFQVMCVD